MFEVDGAINSVSRAWLTCNYDPGNNLGNIAF